MLAAQLSECYAAEFDESWERDRTANASGCSPSASTKVQLKLEALVTELKTLQKQNERFANRVEKLKDENDALQNEHYRLQ